MALLLGLVALLGAPAGPTVRTQPCDEGGRPGYFVPGGDAVIIGCARLGMSGKPVEFSAGRERIAGEAQVCVNAAYRGRGRLGSYIPSACRSPSASREPTVFRVEVPRQAVRGYRLVIWGTVPPSSRGVVARYRGGRTTGAVLRANRGSFSAFVVELPLSAACHPIELRITGSSAPARERLRARPKLC